MALTEEQAKSIKKQLLAQIEKLPKDQVGDLKEQIEEASPEELEEFIKQQQAASQGQQKCIFCEIIAGRIDSIKIYEDMDILVLMEIMPASKGHILILPKHHYQYIQEIPDPLMTKLIYFVKTISPILIKILDAKSLSIYIPQGQLAGQRIQHFVINIIPRYEADNLSFDWEHKKADNKELKETAEKIKKASHTEVLKGIKEEQEKYEKKKKESIASEADQISKQIKKRKP